VEKRLNTAVESIAEALFFIVDIRNRLFDTPLEQTSDKIPASCVVNIHAIVEYTHRTLPRVLFGSSRPSIQIHHQWLSLACRTPAYTLNAEPLVNAPSFPATETRFFVSQNRKKRVDEPYVVVASAEKHRSHQHTNFVQPLLCGESQKLDIFNTIAIDITVLVLSTELPERFPPVKPAYLT
jgi:hypothetical protein